MLSNLALQEVTVAQWHAHKTFIAEKCLTVAGPKSGMRCIFPFVADGVSYNGCTKHGIEDTEYMPWCSTKVDDYGKHIKGNWGDCSSECPVDNTCKCHFPFNYEGNTYYTCTLYGTPVTGIPWCAHKTDDLGNHVIFICTPATQCPGRNFAFQETIEVASILFNLLSLNPSSVVKILSILERPLYPNILS